jgi:hypothetical protein
MKKRSDRDDWLRPGTALGEARSSNFVTRASHQPAKSSSNFLRSRSGTLTHEPPMLPRKSHIANRIGVSPLPMDRDGPSTVKLEALAGPSALLSHRVAMSPESDSA